MELKEALDRLGQLEHTLYAYHYAMGVMSYDSETAAPELAAEGRGEALGTLSEVEYQLTAGPETGLLLEALEQHKEQLTTQQAAQLRVLKKQYDMYSKVPAAEVVEYTKLLNKSAVVWRKAKNENDFAAFAPYLEQLVETSKRFAGYFAPDKHPYDAWLDQYEPGMTRKELDGFFALLRSRIVPLLHRIQTEGQAPDISWLQQYWPREGQEKLSAKVMEIMGLNNGRCTLGETEHPFTTGFSRDDVRITTHYYDEDFTFSLFSVVHEGGHALYEMGVSPRLARTSLSGGASMGIHESQSRFYENLIGRSRAFAGVIWPVVRECFPAQTENVTEEQFWRTINRVEPSLIRTEADELTYCLHIMVRYELEKQLFDGTMQVKDLPAAWNRLMEEYLGVQVPDDTRGVLQDTHWSGGSFGYFPSYALGSAYGAQMMASMRKDLDVDALVAQGSLQPVTDWLGEKIHQYGEEHTPDWLLQNACGAAFDPAFYVKYLEEKYTMVYGLQ